MQKAIGGNCSKKDSLLKENLLHFFNKKRLDIVADVLEKKTKYSLRIVEWFISNYSKKNNTTIQVKGKPFNVYSSYKNGQLKSFSKKQFDLFRRGKRFVINIDKDRCIETTVAQLNFFRWAIENNILVYVQENLNTIKKDMDNYSNCGEKKKKQSQNIIVTKSSITIYFD